MNCDGVRGLLSAYLDGELTPGELLRVEQHLRRCHACADEVDALRQTISLVASLDEVEVPAYFQERLHQRLVAMGPPSAKVRRLPAAPSWQRNLRRWAVPAAAAAAALAIGLTSLNQGGANLEGMFVREYAPDLDSSSQSGQVARLDPGEGSKPVTQPGQPGLGEEGPQTGSPGTPVEENTTPGTSDDRDGGRNEQGTEPVTPPNDGLVAQNPDTTRPVTDGAEENIGVLAVAPEPQVSYHYRVSATAENRPGAIMALKAAFANVVEQNGKVTVRVPAEQRQEAEERLREIEGLTVDAVVLDERDLAVEIARSEQTLADLSLQLEQVSQIEDGTERQAKEQGLRELIREAEDSLARLQDLVMHATFEVVIQLPTQ